MANQNKISKQLQQLAALGLGLGIALAPPLTTAAESPSALTWHTTLDARYDENIGLAPDSASKRETLTTHIEGGLNWQAYQSTTQDLSFTVAPFYNGVSTLADLSNYGVALSLNFQQQLGASFTSPFIATEVKAQWLEYQDSEIRDGYRVDAQLALGKQFNPRFSASIGAKYHYRVSTNDNPQGGLLDRNSDDVFDVDRYGPFIKLEYSPAPKTNFFFEYNYMTGDVAATGNGTAFNNPAAFDAARDFAFEEGINFVTWRIDADQNIYALGVSQEITDKLGLQLTFNYLEADGEFDNNYENMVITAGLTWSF